MYSVITEYRGISASQVWSVTRQFTSREAALDYISEEIFQEDTLRVRCPELDLEEVGEVA